MILLDEQLNDQAQIVSPLAEWYHGRVVTIQELGWSGRPDPSLVRLLHEHGGCTFVTENTKDFWRCPHIPPDRRYCIVNVTLQADRRREIPRLVRWLLQQPAFQTRDQRGGWILRLSSIVTDRQEEIQVLGYRRQSDPPICVVATLRGRSLPT